MQRYFYLFLVFYLSGAPLLRAQYDETSHQVRVEVESVSRLSVSPAHLQWDLRKDDFERNSFKLEKVDDTTILRWTVSESSRKITVEASPLSPYDLEIEAVNPTAGMAGSPVVVDGGKPEDLVLDVGKSAGHTAIRYTVTADLEDGPGSVDYTVMFTITAQ